MIRIFGTTLAALAGLAFGSFLNVCLSRWPAGESVVKPRSHCRACGRTLSWWENVPLLSWLALRGRCRTCGSGISWRYPLVEFAVGVLWGTIVWQALSNVVIQPVSTSSQIVVSYSPRFLLEHFLMIFGKMALTWILVGLAGLDAERLWLPDIATLGALVLGVAVTFLRGDFLLPIGSRETSPLENLLGIALALILAAGVVLLIRWIYWLVRRREGIGLGDAKLMAMLAAWLGLPGALLSFAIGVVLGACVALIFLAIPAARRGSETWALTKLPLGTFLCIGGIISSLWGGQIINAYLRWSGLS
jgi:leader peptidase (prepilin peptidase) / N-methyltransferase